MTQAASEMQALKYRRRESQPEKLHTREDQKWGQMDHAWADRPPSAFSCLTQSPHLLGKLPAAAAATIKPDSSLALATLPFSHPPPLTPAIISLVQNELLQLQPRQLFHLGASAGTW